MCPGEARPSLPRVVPNCPLALPADQARAGHERLDRIEVLACFLVDRDRRQVRVAARVDRERPRIPLEIVRPNTDFVTAARWPAPLAIAERATSMACAPYAAYGFGVVPI